MTLALRFLCLVGFALASGVPLPAATPSFIGPATAGSLEAPPKREASGIAFSRRSADLLWLHDDSGGQPVLYAVGTDGKRVGSIRVRGVKNEDWEDVASFHLDGKAWLLIADTGDNNARRATVTLHLLEEPPREHLAVQGDLTITPTWSMRLRYEDGPRDCESIAVDPAGRAVYLLTKRDDPPRLYRVELAASQRGGPPAVARRIGMVPHLPDPSFAERLMRGHLGKRRSEVSAMDFSSDGSMAVVLTYGAALLFERRANEPWAETLAREPVHLPPHSFLQAEAICFSSDGKAIYVASEGTELLLRYDRE